VVSCNVKGKEISMAYIPAFDRRRIATCAYE